MAEDAIIKSNYSDIYETSRAGWDNFATQAMTDLDFALKAQYTEDEAHQAEIQDRDLFTIDKIGRQLNLLHGYEIRNRHILKIGSQGSIDMPEDIACGQHTKLLMSLMARRGGYEVLSDAFKWGTLVQGSNLIEIWRDRDRNLRFGRLGWNQFLLNPNVVMDDLSDCGDIMTGQWISKDKTKSLLPSAADKIDKIRTLSQSSRWPFLGTPALGNKAGLRLFEQWWRRETEFEQRVISRLTGQEISFTELVNKFFNGDVRLANQKINDMRLPNGAPALSKFSKPVDIIKLSIFVDDELVWDGVNPLKLRDYNYVWVHGDWCPESPRSELKLQSYVRRLRDPQRALNRRTNQIYDIIESQLQGRRILRDKYVRNPEDAYKSGQGVVLHVNDDAPDGMGLREIFEQLPASDVPQSLFAALEMTDKAETEAGGLNQEIFGSDDKDIPAILGRFRTGQALTGQAPMFQSFRNSKRQLGIKLVRAVQLNYPPDKVAEIINEQPSQGFYEENLTKFDCNPVEGLLTDSQQQLFYLELKALRSEFPEAAASIPLSELVKYSPTPFKRELTEIIQKAEQRQNQAQQQMQQIQQTAQALEIERAKGEILATRGIAEERRAQAVENQSDAALNRIKTIAEINDIGTQRLFELIDKGIALEQLQQQNIEVKAKS